MRFGWTLRFGPFWLRDTIFDTRRRRLPAYHGELPGWRCPHSHRRPDTAIACAEREARRRAATRW